MDRSREGWRVTHHQLHCGKERRETERLANGGYDREGHQVHGDPADRGLVIRVPGRCRKRHRTERLLRSGGLCPGQGHL